MCTRFVYRGDDTITGFNFEIDLAVWDHKIITEKDRFYIGTPVGVRGRAGRKRQAHQRDRACS